MAVPRSTRASGKARAATLAGRPRGDTRAIPAVGLGQALRKAARQPVSMSVDGRRTKQTLGDAIIYQLLARALKGDHRSTKLYCDLVRTLDTGGTERSHEEWLALLDDEEEAVPATN